LLRADAHAFALTQMARKTGDRDRDLDRALSERLQWAAGLGEGRSNVGPQE